MHRAAKAMVAALAAVASLRLTRQGVRQEIQECFIVPGQVPDLSEIDTQVRHGCFTTPGRQLTGSADTASAASRTARPGTIFRPPRLVCDPLPVPKLVAPAVKVNALPVVLA